MIQARLALAIGLLAAPAVGLTKKPLPPEDPLAVANEWISGLDEDTKESLNRDVLNSRFTPRLRNNETYLGPKYSWITHHKTGTELSYGIALILSEHMGEGSPRLIGFGYGGLGEEIDMRALGYKTYLDGAFYERFSWTEAWNEEEGEGCTATKVGVHANGLPQQYRKVARQCPNFKGVHMSRDPVEILLSAYTYHVTEQGRRDCLPNSCTNARLNRSIADGLKVEAADEMRYVVQPMLDVLKLAMCDKRMLPLTMESHFEVDFDNTSRTVLRHMLVGTPYEKDIEDLVVKFAAEDVSRTEESGGHFTDGGLKDEARAVLETIKDDPRIAPIFEAKRQFEAIWASGCTLLSK